MEDEFDGPGTIPAAQIDPERMNADEVRILPPDVVKTAGEAVDADAIGMTASTNPDRSRWIVDEDGDLVFTPRMTGFSGDAQIGPPGVVVAVKGWNGMSANAKVIDASSEGEELEFGSRASASGALPPPERGRDRARSDRGRHGLGGRHHDAAVSPSGPAGRTMSKGRRAWRTWSVSTLSSCRDRCS